MYSYSFPHKICDAVHGFIRFSPLEMKVIDSRPFQRLRYLHQMGPAYLVYPGATHSRFEHSLGVMELASRAYDTLMSPHVLMFVQEKFSEKHIVYWRSVLRMAALCHDIGHLPFSHTAEKELLPDGGHEKMTMALIQSDELKPIWKELGPGAQWDILKLSVQEKELLEWKPELQFTPWEKVLSSIITDDNFGVDRIDYLIRDAQHTGVAYGHFDYQQLIDTLRILPDARGNLSIGIAESGIQSVESLWIARYLMYARVYHHPKVRLFAHHLRRFMVKHYEKVGFSKGLEDYLFQTDIQILSSIAEQARKGDLDAKVLLKQAPAYSEVSLDAFPEKDLLGKLEALQSQFKDKLFVDALFPKSKKTKDPRSFWVLSDEGKIISSGQASQFLPEIPLGGKSLRLYARSEDAQSIEAWLKQQVPRGSIE